MYDCGGLLNITICVDVCPVCPTISLPRGLKLIARGVAIPASASVPPPTGKVRAAPLRPTRKNVPKTASGGNSVFSRRPA